MVHHLDIVDYNLQALVDNELKGSHEQEVRALVNSDAQARQRYEELCLQKEQLKKWWKHTQLLSPQRH